MDARPERRVSGMRLLTGAVLAVVVMGVIALTSPRAVEADLEGFELDTNVVISGGVVTATVSGLDDDNVGTASSNVYVYASTANVDNSGGVADTTTLPAGITEVSCVVGAAEDDCSGVVQTCTDAADPPNNPEPDPDLFACVSFEEADLDGDDTPEPFTAVLAITVTCGAEVAEPEFVTIFASDQDPASSSEARTVLCILAQNFFLTKDFADPAAAFTFSYEGSGCVLDGDLADDANPLVVLTAGDEFSILGGQTVGLGCGLNIGASGPGAESVHTVAELGPDGAEFETVTCEGDSEANVAEQSATFTVTFDFQTQDVLGEGACTFVNVVAEEDDDPSLPNIDVTKVCVGEFEATFEITVGDDTLPIECGETITFADLEPGPYDVTETIAGGDGEGFATVITCDDGDPVEGTTATVTLVAGADSSCIVVNGIGVDELVCPCGDEIEIDNTNNNTIDIDNANTNTNANDNNNENDNENKNENENNNVNTNTQNQENTQGQDNANEQTNNITSSPEVNIDFDDKH